MWVFTRDGFFSVVKKECKADEVMVRARQKSDLLGLGKKLNLTLCIQTDAGTDYAFRAVLKQSDWAGYLADEAMLLDYENFKGSLSKKDHERQNAYFQCWRALLNRQEQSRPKNRNRSGVRVKNA